MNYIELIERLKKVTPEDYEFEARVLIETFTDYKMSYIFSHRDEQIVGEALEKALQRRESREPLQYIVGKWDFYRQTYYVDENCLIPRADTEILVEKAIEILPKNARFIDLCTGSGCIAISTLCERNDTQAVAVDKFEKTLDVAKKNAKLNGVEKRVDLMILDVLSEENKLEGYTFDAILSNPPYIRPEVIETLSEEVKHEPYAALWGGDDGLIFYKKIVKDYSRFLNNNGFILFEIGYDQAESLRIIADENGFNCEIIKDYGGCDRVAYLYKK